MTNGTIEGLQGSIPASSKTLEDEQALSDSEQTLAESDQTLSDADQTGSDSDQTSADCDQLASDRDQEASDRDLAAGADEETHDANEAIRERSAERRDQTGRARMDTGDQRDATASARDHAAQVRDRAADARDRTIAQRELAAEPAGGRTLNDTDKLIRSKGRRKRAAQHYAQAAEYRTLAAEDRQAAAQDREQAARDRLRATTDPLTGARAQAAGLTDIDHELDRCRRTYGRLVVAFVELVVNAADEHHQPSDEMLKRVTALLTSQLRSYDLVIRLDGDQLLCAMSNITVPDARERFTAIAATISDTSDEGTIQIGYADVAHDETATELIARAEHDLVASDGYQDSRPELPAGVTR